MSIEQANDLLDSLESSVEPQQQETIKEVPDAEEADQADLEASEILNNGASEPERVDQPLPPTVSVDLKTRSDLIKEIKRQYSVSGDDVKSLNLGRRRKNSLKRILGERCARFAEKQSRPQMPREIEDMMPQDLDEREKFCVSMLYRFDLCCCALVEHGCEYTEKYHGLSARGFAQSIDENETLQEEIKSAWSDVLANEENRWVLEYCGPGSRLAMCHLYALAQTVRKAPPKTERAIKNDFRPEKIQMPPRSMGPLKTSGRLVHACGRKQASRKERPHKIPAPQAPRGLVKQV